MPNTPYKTRRLGFTGDARVPYAWAGWNDAMAGRGIDYALLDNSLSVACAHAYETARLRVLALRAAGLPVPRWNSVNRVPPAIHAAISLTNSFNVMARGDGTAIWPTGDKYWRPAA